MSGKVGMHKQCKEITKELLIELYLVQNLTMVEISVKLGCCKKTIQDKIKKFNLKIDNKTKFLNKPFGNLIVKEYLGHKNGRAQYRCDCICGKSIITNSNTLNAGKKSCGCRINMPKLNQNRIYASGEHHHCWIGYEQISGKYFSRIKSNAIDRGLVFDITIEYIWSLYLIQNSRCQLSGVNIYFHNKTASLDRIDSNKGYTTDNVQWVHKDINYMKQEYNQDYFIEMCKHVAERNNEK